jgi:hypothetical protein
MVAPDVEAVGEASGINESVGISVIVCPLSSRTTAVEAGVIFGLPSLLSDAMMHAVIPDGAILPACGTHLSGADDVLAHKWVVQTNPRRTRRRQPALWWVLFGMPKYVY